MKRSIKSKISNVLISILVVSLSFVLCACGARIDTTMKPDENFKGERVITVTVDSDDFSSITGGTAALDNVAKTNLPSELTYSSALTESGFVMTFTLSYTDKADYENKVNALLEKDAGDDGEVKKAEIMFSGKDTVFKKGVAFSENFTSAELLAG